MTNSLQIDICTLEYSYGWNCFHMDIELNKLVHKDWVVLANPIDEIDALHFIEFMYKKYVAGRKSGRYPSVDIVKLELELFFKLKATKRRLVNQ